MRRFTSFGFGTSLRKPVPRPIVGPTGPDPVAVLDRTAGSDSRTFVFTNQSTNSVSGSLDFGDGTSAPLAPGATVAHRYAVDPATRRSDYVATLTALNDEGRSATAAQGVSAVTTDPVANFTATPTFSDGPEGSSLLLTNTSTPGTAPITDLLWTVIIDGGGSQYYTTDTVDLTGLGMSNGGVASVVVTLKVDAAEDGGSATSAPRTFDITEPVSGSGTVLALSNAGNANDLTAGEKRVRDALIAAGYTVPVLGSTYASKVAADVDLVLLLNLGTGNWWNSYATLAKPVVCASAGGAAGLRMGTSGKDSSLPETTMITRSPIPHPASAQPAGDYAAWVTTVKADGTVVNPADFPIAIRDYSRHALALSHTPGDRFSPCVLVHDRGEPMGLTGFLAPARRALVLQDMQDTLSRDTDAAIQEIVSAVAWAMKDEGAGLVTPLLDIAIHHDAATDTTNFTLTDISTGGATGVTIRHYSQAGALLGSYTPGPGGVVTLSNRPNGFEYVEIEAQKAGDVARRRVYALYGEVYAPRAKLTTSITHEEANNHSLKFDASKSQDRGVPIQSYEMKLWFDTAKTSLARTSGPQPLAVLEMTGLANASYTPEVVVTNTDGVSDSVTGARITVPRPPLNHYAEVHGVAGDAFGYYFGEAPSGVTITSIAWDMDRLANPGAFTGIGVHPKVHTPYTSGDRPWSCTVTMSNGWVGTPLTAASAFMRGKIQNSPALDKWRAWQPTTWAFAQDYTTPAHAPSGKTIYCDADTGSDFLADGVTPNPGTDPATPIQTTARINKVLAAGDIVNMAGDFSSQGGWKITVNQAGDPTKHTLIQQWAGRTQATFQIGDEGINQVIWLDGCHYVRLENLTANGRSAGDRWGHCYYSIGGSHNTVYQCTSTYGNSCVYFSNHKFGWAEKNFCDLVGRSPLDAKFNNGGNGYVCYDGSDDCTIYDNIALRCGHNGIDLIRHQDTADSFRVRVAYNEVNNEWAGSFGGAGGNDYLVEHNQFHNIGTLVGSTAGSKDGINLRGDYWVERFNRIWGARSHPLQVQTNTAAGRIHARRGHSYHNTYFNCQGPAQYFQQDYTAQSVLQQKISHLEENVIENDLFLFNDGLNFPKPGTVWYQFTLFLSSTYTWAIQNLYGLDGTPVPPIDPAGNILRNCLFWADATSRTNKMFLIVRRSENGNNVGYDTWTQVQADFPTWTNNLEVDPLVLSTTEGDPNFLVIDNTSPAWNAGNPVAGVVYNGHCPIGWSPEFTAA